MVAEELAVLHGQSYHEFGPAGQSWPKSDLTESHHGIRNLVVHPGCSLTRPPMELLPPNSEFVNGVASKDVMIDKRTNVWARIYLPKIAVTPECKKLPLILYFHGGGFVCMSADTRMVHEYCETVLRTADAIIVSVEYRLAPEHRLPIQYEDAFTSLMWLQSQALLLQQGTRKYRNSTARGCNGDIEEAEPWLASHADFSRCFLMGESAGGNIAHHLATQACMEQISPLHLSGQILVQPGFGGMIRTPSELYCREKSLPLAAIDLFWKLALPTDADRNHPACHVFPKVAELRDSGFSLPDTLLVVGGRDPLYDWNLLYFEALESANTKIHLLKYDDAIHGFNLRQNKWTSLFVGEIARFINT